MLQEQRMRDLRALHLGHFPPQAPKTSWAHSSSNSVSSVVNSGATPAIKTHKCNLLKPPKYLIVPLSFHTNVSNHECLIVKCHVACCY